MTRSQAVNSKIRQRLRYYRTGVGSNSSSRGCNRYVSGLTYWPGLWPKASDEGLSPANPASASMRGPGIVWIVGEIWAQGQIVDVALEEGRDRLGGGADDRLLTIWPHREQCQPSGQTAPSGPTVSTALHARHRMQDIVILVWTGASCETLDGVQLASVSMTICDLIVKRP